MQQLLSIIILFIVMVILTFFLLYFTHQSVHARPGFWQTSGDKEIDDWFAKQKIPGGRTLCCSVSDGKFVEEDIRDGHYWARWEETKGEWIPVPDEAIINEPNKWGLPAVWWGVTDDDGSANDAKIYIRCYAPGAKG